MRWWIGGYAILLALVPLAAGSQPKPPEGRDRIEVEHGGNRLTVWRAVPVASSRLEQFVLEIQHPLPARVRAARLWRTAPRQIIDFALCVTPDGTLIVGRQILSFDPAVGRYIFARGEIERGYPPLEQAGPWTWLVNIPVSRELTAALEIRAASGRGPVSYVTIAVAGSP